VVKYKHSGLRSVKEEEVKNCFMYQYLVYSVFPLKTEYVWFFVRSDVWCFHFSSSVDVIKLQNVGHKLLESVHS